MILEYMIFALAAVLILSGLLNIFQTYRIKVRDQEMDELVKETNKRLQSATDSFKELSAEIRRESDFKLQQVSKQAGRMVASMPLPKGAISTVIVRIEEIVNKEISRGFKCDLT